MSKIITQDAEMQCTLGVKTSKIVVTSQSFNSINGKLIATEKDKGGNINIPSFGNCKCSATLPTCIPNPIVWEQTTTNNTILNFEKLTIKSICHCSKGGTISFINSSVNSFLDTE